MSDPGPLGRLSEPEWPRAHKRPPVRVSDTPRKRAGKGGAPPPPAITTAQRTALVDRITSGKSSLSIDVSSFTPSKGVADTEVGRERYDKGQEFQKQYLAYLKELAATDVGYRLLSDLDKSPNKTVINFDLRSQDNHTLAKPDGVVHKGEPAVITMNPSLKTFDDNQGKRDAPWMTEREKYGYYHELVHAWHITRGTQATGSHNGVSNSEWQATGFGPHADPNVNDNAIRRAFGKAERPGYSGKSF